MIKKCWIFLKVAFWSQNLDNFLLLSMKVKNQNGLLFLLGKRLNETRESERVLLFAFKSQLFELCRHLNVLLFQSLFRENVFITLQKIIPFSLSFQLHDDNKIARGLSPDS